MYKKFRNTSSANRAEERRRNEKYLKIMEFNRGLCMALITIFMILQITKEIQYGSLGLHVDTNVILICVVITGLIDILGRKFRKREGL